MKRLIAIALIVVGCSSNDTAMNDRDTMTQRQRDSVLAQSSIPGAGGVGKALSAADSLRARNARLDSVRP